MRMFVEKHPFRHKQLDWPLFLESYIKSLNAEDYVRRLKYK